MNDTARQSDVYEPWAPSGDEEKLQLQPANIEAEQALLGAVLLKNEVFDSVSGFLTGAHFFDPTHGRIFDACGEMIKTGHLANPITLKTYFENDAALAEIGGPVYLARLVGASMTSVPIHEYAHVIFDMAIRRGLIEIGQHLQATAFDAPLGTTPLQIAEEAEGNIAALMSVGIVAEQISTVGTAAERALNHAAEAYRVGRPVGLSTGLPSLDEVIGPMTPGMMIVLGGATSMAKTALADQICNFNAREENIVCVEFSLEMQADDLATRQLARIARVPAWRIEAGKFSEQEYMALSAAKESLSKIPLYIEDRRGLTVAQMRSRARQVKRKHGLGLVMIDHLQFVRSEDTRAAPHIKLEQITADLKVMAGDLGVPIILISHLSRETQKRDGNRPILSDLHGSSAIEKDADVVAFVHRPEYYLERQRPEEGSPEWIAWLDQINKWKGLAEVIVAKRRKGAGAGTRKFNFAGQYTEFSEIETIDPGPEIGQEEFGI